MSPIKIVTVAAGLLAITASSAMADGFRYAGSPKFGQFYVRDQSGSMRTSILDARAQVIEPRRDLHKGGISARGL
jgi:hypothetical protein